MGRNSYNNIEFDFKIKIIMEKKKFLILLNETLELENPELNEKSSINLTSIMNLSLIVFLDENFNLRVTGKDLKDIDSIKKIIQLIGKDKFE
jgi:acyl carrier protein